MSIMRKWKEYAEGQFGDFEDEECFGILRSSKEEYRFGVFNKDLKENGINVHRFPERAILAKYKNGKPLFPITEVHADGWVDVQLSKKKDVINVLRLNTLDSSFLYYPSKDGITPLDGPAISFNGKDGVLSFLYHKDGAVLKESPIERRFVPEKPIVCPRSYTFPELPDFSRFYHYDRDDAGYNENSQSGDFGIGVIAFPNGDREAVGWKEMKKFGWGICQKGDNHFVFYNTNFKDNGLQVYSLGKEKDVDIFSIVDWGETETITYGLCFHKGILIFGDISIDDGLIAPKGLCLRMPSYDGIEFVDYNGDSFGDSDMKVLEAFKAPTHAEEDLSKKSAEVAQKEEEESKIPAIPEDLFTEERDMMNLIGLNAAKKELLRLHAYMRKNDPGDNPINFIFTGSAGVGKSTVGRMLSHILYRYDAIERDNFIETSAKTLFDSGTGVTAAKIDEFYHSGQGGVLLIDDLHYLNSLNLSNIKEGVAKLASIMKGDSQTTFILCDNKADMKSVLDEHALLLEDVVRFRIDFTDFSRDELRQILKSKARKKGYILTEEALSRLLDVAFSAKELGGNVNASSATSALEDVIVAQNVRSQREEDKSIVKEDVDAYIKDHGFSFLNGTGGDARKKLDELIGLETIKETIDDLIAYFSLNRGKKVDFHMVFTGNPGTGKTEVARILGELLRQEGILPTSRFVEVSRRDLIGEYIGQTAIKTHEVIDRAMGGVLYIDEAYSLAYGGEKDYGKEAIAELIKAMEDRRGEFCLIMAGYTSEMKRLFDLNPGLKSRVKFNLDFPDYTDEELERILRLFLRRENVEMDEEDIKLLIRLVSKQRAFPNFANARTVRDHFSRAQIKRARRLKKEGEDASALKIEYEDIVATFGKKAVEDACKEEEVVPAAKADPNILSLSYKKIPLLPFKEKEEEVIESVVAIVSKGEHGGDSSGFIISPDGYVVTCAHCVDGAEKIDIRRRFLHRGKKVDIHYQGQLISIDKEADLAILKMNLEEGEEVEYIALEEKGAKRLPPLSEVYLLGYPFGVSRFDDISVNQGKIASHQKGKGGQKDQINLDISAKSGNSGSLVIDGNTSRVIGVLVGASLSMREELTETIVFARPASYIWELLDREYELDASEIGQKALEATRFAYLDNQDEYNVEIREYKERSGEQVFRHFLDAEMMASFHDAPVWKEKLGKDLLLAFKGVMEDRFLFAIYEETPSGYKKKKAIALGKEDDSYDGRLYKNEKGEWVRLSIQLLSN